MNFIAIHPIRPLFQAWKRFRLRRGGKLTRATRDKAKQTQAKKSHHRHIPFLELP
jgi:hypothetical protein